MGTKFTPSYANLFMGHFESQFIQNQHTWVENIVLYKCYIDDLVLIWDGSDADFAKFTTHLNQNNYGTTLSGKITSDSVEYLDVVLTAQRNNILHS